MSAVDFSDLATSNSNAVDFSDLEAPAKPSVGSRVMSAAGTLGKGALETVAAPFQVLGEAIRGAGEGEPLRVATASNQKGFRVPSIVQRIAPALGTDQPPADPFVKAYQGLEGAANLPNGIQKASDTVTAKPDLAANIGGGALALGTGDAGNLPMEAITKPIGAILGTAPKLLGKLAQYSNVTKDADPAIQAAADAFHFPSTPAGVSQSPTQSLFESIMSNLPFAREPFMERFKSQIDTLKGMKDQLFQKGQTTGPVDQEIEQQLGTLLQDRVTGASQSAYKAAQGDYQAVGNVAKGKQIPTPNLEQTAQNLFDSQSKLPPPSRASGSVNILDQFRPKEVPINPDIENMNAQFPNATPEAKANMAAQLGQQVKQNGPSGPQQYDYQTLQGIRADLNARIAQADQGIGSGMKFQSSPEAGIYKQLKAALDKDLSVFGQQKGNEDFGQALDNANNNYATYKTIFKENPLVTSIAKAQNPVDALSAMSRSLMKPNNLAESGVLKNLLGDEAYSYLSDHMVNQLTMKDGQFSPTKIISSYQKLGDQGVSNILGDDKMKIFRPLYLLAKASKNAELMANNPSGTGRVIGAFATMIHPIFQMLTGHFSSGAGQLGSEMAALPALAHGYLSPTAMQLLTNQPVQLGETISKAAQPIMNAGNVMARTAGPLLGAMNQKGNQN